MKIILGFSCGCRNSEPGLSNTTMATVIKKEAAMEDIISVQLEIATALKKFGLEPHHVVSKRRKPGLLLKNYLDTEEVAIQMVDYLRESNLLNTHIYIVAHQLHMSRCIRVFRKLGVTAAPIKAEIPCDPLSNHFWTRNPGLIRAHEILAFPIYLLRGYYTS